METQQDIPHKVSNTIINFIKTRILSNDNDEWIRYYKSLIISNNIDN